MLKRAGRFDLLESGFTVPDDVVNRHLVRMGHGVTKHPHDMAIYCALFDKGEKHATKYRAKNRRINKRAVSVVVYVLLVMVAALVFSYIVSHA